MENAGWNRSIKFFRRALENSTPSEIQELLETLHKEEENHFIEIANIVKGFERISWESCWELSYTDRQILHRLIKEEYNAIREAQGKGKILIND